MTTETQAPEGALRAAAKEALDRLEIYATDHCWPVDREVCDSLRAALAAQPITSESGSGTAPRASAITPQSATPVEVDKLVAEWADAAGMELDYDLARDASQLVRAALARFARPAPADGDALSKALHLLEQAIQWVDTNYERPSAIHDEARAFITTNRAGRTNVQPKGTLTVPGGPEWLLPGDVAQRIAYGHPGTVTPGLVQTIAKAVYQLKAAAQAPAPGVVAIPAGWSIARDEDTGPGCIRVFSPVPGPGGTTLAPPGGSLAYRLLYALCNDLLAAPTAPAPAVKDAARYRWLSSDASSAFNFEEGSPAFKAIQLVWEKVGTVGPTKAELDAVIDAAMAFDVPV